MVSTMTDVDPRQVTQRVYAVLVVEAEMEQKRALEALARLPEGADSGTVLLFEAAYAARQNALTAMINLFRASGALDDGGSWTTSEDGAVVRAFELAPLEYRAHPYDRRAGGCQVCGTRRAVLLNGMCRQCRRMTDHDEEDM